MALAKALRMGSVSAVILMYSTALARYNKTRHAESGAGDVGSRLVLVAVTGVSRLLFLWFFHHGGLGG